MDNVNDALRTANALMASLPAASIHIDGCHRELTKSNMSVFLSSLSRISAPQRAIPKQTGDMTVALPDDCVRIIMEFAVGRRLMATFGAGGRVNEARTYYGNHDKNGYLSIHMMRLVSRKWNRIASKLVSILRFKITHLRIRFDHAYMANLFPNVTYIKLPITEKDMRTFIADLNAIKSLLVKNRPTINGPYSVFMHGEHGALRSAPHAWTRRFYQPSGEYIRHLYVRDFAREFQCQEMPSLPARPSDVWHFAKLSVFIQFMKSLKPTAEMQINPITVQITTGCTLPPTSQSLKENLETLELEVRNAVQIHVIEHEMQLYTYQQLQMLFPRRFIYHVTAAHWKRWTNISRLVYPDAPAYTKLLANRSMLEPIV